LNKVLSEKVRQLLEAQEELVRKEKLSTLGQIAGSVGHELRNPLGVINNAVYFLQTVLSDADPTTREYLNIIKDEILNADRIVGDLLDSVRIKPPQPQNVAIGTLIEQVLRRIAVPDGINVTLDIPAAQPPIRVDPIQVQQVFRNLITNGFDAMPQGGNLDISAVDDATLNVLSVKVKDSGIGIAPENMAKLFQPLFTTKARGIGLGLVVVKNLTQSNGGTVTVESVPGKGSTFTVTLPAAESA
jgi:signal transduction histidine kinase